MDSTRACSDLRLFPLLVRGYLLGTLAAAFALHIVVSLIAPGDGGTMIALGSGPILFAILIVLGIVGLVVFPLAAIVSWPLRGLVFQRPFVALALSAAVGTAIGAILTATELQVGPGDFYSGPVVGFVYALVWFLVIRAGKRATELA